MLIVNFNKSKQIMNDNEFRGKLKNTDRLTNANRKKKKLKAHEQKNTFRHVGAPVRSEKTENSKIGQLKGHKIRSTSTMNVLCDCCKL